MSGTGKLAWVAVLYFAEGFPYGIVYDAIPVYLRLHDVRLADIGLLNLVGLAWTLKFLWAPAVDLWGERRHWILVCQGCLTAGLAALIFVPPGRVSWLLWAAMAALAVASATQDIAIDAYTITLLDPEEMGPANGVRVTAYRIALIVAGGLFVAAAGLLGWPQTLALAAVLMGLLAAGALAIPPAPGDRTASRRRGRGLRDAIWTPLQPFFAIPGFPAVLLFVLTYKLGDMALGPMVRPFWVDRQFTPVQIGAVPGTLGVVATILGALWGGALAKRWGLVRALWILGIAQAGSNLVYAAAAFLPPSATWMYAASVTESFCGGLGTAPFLAFLMSICDKSHAATQYALLSALFGLTRVLAGAVSGWAAEAFGYGAYFALTFLLAWPALLLLPRVQRWSLARGAVQRQAGTEP